jgi:hypothetical protein
MAASGFPPPGPEPEVADNHKHWGSATCPGRRHGAALRPKCAATVIRLSVAAKATVAFKGLAGFPAEHNPDTEKSDEEEGTQRERHGYPPSVANPLHSGGHRQPDDEDHAGGPP